MDKEQITKYRNEASALMETITNKHLRQLQANMHTCAAKCYTDKNLSLEQLEDCHKECSEFLGWIYNYSFTHVNRLDDDLGTCMKTCESNKKNDTSSQAEVDYNNCVTSCGNTAIEKLRNLFKELNVEAAKELKKKT